MTPAAVLQILVTASTSQATAALTRTDAQLKKTAATAQTSSTSMGSTIAKGAKVGGLAVAALGAVSIKAAADFESAFAEVLKTVDTSEKGFARIERGLRNMAKEIPVSVEELANLAGQAGALGVKAKDIVDFTRVAADLGVTTDLSAEAAANSLARLANIMDSKSRKAFARMGATLVDLGNKGASTEDEIAEMALRIAGAGKQIGLTEPEVLGLSAALANVGIRAEMGGTAISRVMLQMQDAIARGGEQLQSFADITGISGRRFAAIFEQDATRAVAMFAAGLSQVSKEGGSTLQALEAVELNERRVGDTLARVGNNTRQFTDAQRVANTAWRENVALTEEANKRYGTTASRFQVFKNRVNDLFISIGQQLLPVVNRLLQFFNSLDVNKAVRALKDFWQEAGVVRSTVKVVGQVIEDVFGGLVQFIGGAVKVISGILSGDFRRAWDGVKDIFRGAANVIVGIVKGITAPLRAAAKAIGGALRDAFEFAWEKIKGVFRGGANVLKDIVNWIISNVINRIPGVELDLIGGGAGGTESGTGVNPNAVQNRFSGGKITKPMAIVGEEAPRHPEFVLATNPAYRRRNLALWEQAGKAMGIPGFQVGGFISGTDNPVAQAGRTAGSYIDKLAGAPFDQLPGFLTGTGDFIKDKFVQFIKDKVESVADVVTGTMTTDIKVPALLRDAIALGARMGLSVTSLFRDMPGTYHNPDYNPPHQAVDLSNSTGPTPQMRNFALAAVKKYGVGRILEMFYDPLGWGIDNYSRGPAGMGGPHFDHVHIAFQKGGIMGKGTGLGLGRKAKLNVNEITTLNAFHDLDDPALMAAISMAESQGVLGAIGDGGASHGPYQVHHPSWPQFSPSRLRSSWGYSIAAAKHIRAAQGLTAWSVYNNGAYRNFLGGRVLSPGDGGGPGGGGQGVRDDGVELDVGEARKPPKATFGHATAELPKKLARDIMRLRELVAGLEEQIAVAEIVDAFASSPAGSDLSWEERAAQIALNDQLLAGLSELAGRLDKGIGKLPRRSPLRRELIEELALIQGPPYSDSKILDVRGKLDELRNPPAETVESVEDQLNALRVPLLQEQLEAAWASNFLLRSQMPTFQRVFDDVPHFGEGGVVPGPVGAPVPAVVHGGEGWFTPEQMAAMGGPGELHVHNYIDGKEFKGIARVELRDELGQIVRTAKRTPIVPGNKTGNG